ncbi:MAG: hypothetical protein HY276_06690 [Ignavibacteriales bacterium]|nr:hypothetical protein [Ignavibacteriales bacterium]MBI3787929.1 hypothetical protein [Ignavibacteriales bacterium]
MSNRLLLCCLVFGLSYVFSSPASATPIDTIKAPSQYPSPMVEYARKHERIPQQEYKGTAFEITGLFSKTVQAFIPQKSRHANKFDLLIHFHGASYISNYAAIRYNGNLIAATVSIGSGSKVYGDAFLDTTKLGSVIDSIVAGTERNLSHKIKIRHLTLSGFSAGYGAIRKILSSQSGYDRVDAVLLLDGIHASYIPERTVLADGGKIDSTGLNAFITLARGASKRNSKKRFLITHSEIFPGTYASTTEATDYIAQLLQIKTTPTLQWGPLGMQQLSEARQNHFAIMGFAGNTARDHVDHFQGLYWFLKKLHNL